jgi:2-hydroxy-6-oxonona-2,4-dienedioate hydrolase
VSTFVSPAAEAAMERWYQHFQAQLSFPHEARTVATSAGPTQVLVSGPEGGLPVVALHGAMTGAAHSLSLIGDFPARYRTYGVDVVGQSVRSAQVRPGPEALGRWLIEVMDGLGLERAALFGASWGGYTALRGAIAAPERVSGLVLLVPGAVIRGPTWPQLRRVTWPMLTYRLFPSPARRDRMLAAQFTALDPMWSAFIADALRYVRLDFSIPPLVTPEELAGLAAPVMVIAADRDIFFPGEALLERARTLFPNLVAAELLEGCCHVPPMDAAFTARLLEMLDDFLETYVGARGYP